MDEHGKPPQNSNGHWVYRRRTIDGAFRGLIVLCALLGLVELVYHRHSLFSFEAVPVAYGIFGFLCFFAIVFAGKALRKLIMRDEDYYDR